jgi:hypothetical protein
MKIVPFTREVFQSFHSINQSIFVKQGSILETISPTKTIKARAVLETVFPRDFAVYDLNRFISSLDLVGQDADVDFQENALVVSDGKRKTKLFYSDPSLVTKVPEKQIQLPSVDVEATLTSAAIKDVFKALKMLRLSEISIAGDGSSVTINAVDTKSPTSDMHSVQIGETDQVFRAVFKAENVVLMPYTYEVSISKHGLAQFKSDRLEYFIAVESESSTF